MKKELGKREMYWICKLITKNYGLSQNIFYKNK